MLAIDFLQPVLRQSAETELTADYSWLCNRYAGWLRPQRCCQAIYQRCSDSITLIHDAVTGVEQGIVLLGADGRHIAQASHVVIANAGDVDKIAGVGEFPVSRARGQLSGIPAACCGEPAHVPLSAESYSTPAYEGMFYAGASYDESDDRGLSQHDHDDNLAKLAKLQPWLKLAAAELNGRVSFRANSLDRVPVVGAVHDVSFFEQVYHDLRHGKRAGLYPGAQHIAGLYINVAHGARGLTSAFLSAEIIVSLVEATPVPVAGSILDHLNPARFMIKRLKRAKRCTD